MANFTPYIESRKDNFICRETKQIEVYKTLIQALTEAKPILKGFDGKVMNKRIETKLNDTVGKGLKVTFSFRRDYSSFGLELGIYGIPDRSFKNSEGEFGYVRQYTARVNRLPFIEDNLTSNGNHLDYEATCKEIDNVILGLENAIKRLADCIENIDKYLQMGEEMKQQVAEYQKSVPSELMVRFVVGDYMGI